MTNSRRFEMRLDKNIASSSGVGSVADGVLFGNNTVVICWRGEFPTFEMHPKGFDSVMAAHGHKDTTRIIWLDDGEEDNLLLDALRHLIAEGAFVDTLKFVRYENDREAVLAVQLDEHMVRVLRDLLRLGIAVYPDDYLVIGRDGRLRVTAWEPFEQTYQPAEENLSPEEQRRRRTWVVEYMVEGNDVPQHARKIASPHYNTEEGVQQWYLQNGAVDVISVRPAYGPQRD